jgi:predicted nucleic acid-binding protein
VLDASVAAKWFLPSGNELLTLEAEQLLEAHSRREIAFVVPDFFWAEMGNVLWKAVRTKRISTTQMWARLADVRKLPVLTCASSDLIEDAMRIALRFNWSIYDSLYVALAVDWSTEMVTADERLANSVAAHLPVKWLGAM